MTIPKIIHQIWIGGTVMHPLIIEWGKKLRALHPGWQVLLWSEGSRPDVLSCEHEDLVSEHPSLLAASCHLSQKSNIWRYEVMRKFGGIYLDTDVEPFRPFDDLSKDTDTFVVKRVNYPHVFECAAFGATPDHPWLNDLVAHLPSRDPKISLSMGVDYFTEVTKRHGEVRVLSDGVIVFEYPDPDPRTLPKQASDTFLTAPVKIAVAPGTYAVHRWSSLWFASSFKPLGGGGN